MKNSHIEWTDHTWNPLLGCDKCSEGCKFCYAIRTAWRLQHNPNPTIAAAYAGLVEQRADGSLNWTGKINLVPDRLRQPISWTKPARIFVNSQSDLFHERVPDEFIDQVFAVMAACPQHTFQVLTKRADRMRDYLGLHEREVIIEAAGEKLALENGWCHAHGGEYWPLPNVWLGVSVENQKAADSRIPALLDTPAAVRFLSCEPLLGPVEFSDVTKRSDCVAVLGRPALEGIHWIICGGESGPNARPMHPAWARSLRDQCQAAGVAFFYKQWGEFLGTSQFAAAGLPGDLALESRFATVANTMLFRVGKAAAGRVLDGRTHDDFPSQEREVR